MSGVCSRHLTRDPTCDACNFDPSEDPILQEAHKRAVKAGLYKCECGFEYYKTVDSCPLCGQSRKK